MHISDQGPRAAVVPVVTMLVVALSGCVLEGAAPSRPGQEEDIEVAAEALSDGLSLPTSQDTSVRLSAPNKNFGSDTSLDINRGLVRVAQESLAGAVAPTDFVESATLELTLVDRVERRRALPRQLGAYRVLKAWTENGATWNCGVDSNPANSAPNCSGAAAWKMIGKVDAYVDSPTGVANVPASRTGVVTLDVTSDVRAFLAGTAVNNGWLLRTVMVGVGEVAELAARESQNGPRLKLTVKRCSASACNDGNACTADACDGTANCVHTPLAGTACSDGNACTQGDQCMAGACAGGASLPAGAACGEALACSGSSAECLPARIVVNEVESNGGTPGDWVELYNAGATPVDVSGWRFKDNDDTHAYAIPSGTSLPAGGYFVLEEAAFGFGLGGADSARLFGPTGTTPIDSHTWTAHAASTYGRCPNGTGSFTSTPSSKAAANDCTPPADGGVGDGGSDGGVGDGGTDGGTDGGAGDGGVAQVVLNEIESNGGTPGDWVELYNAGSAAADVSGWRFKDGDDTHAFYTIPTGTQIASGGYFVLEEAAFGFGLGGADSARLFGPTGTTPIDSYAWTAHAASTYGRCPNGTGAFTSTPSTKAAANDCAPPPDGGVGDGGTDGGVGDGGIDGGAGGFAVWPGSPTAETVDTDVAFGGNMSGLTYQPASAGGPAILWAVQNNPSVLFRAEWNGVNWVPATADGWGAGKTLLYPSGTGVPDTESISKATFDQPAIYAVAERDNAVSGVSRLSILRFDTSASGTALTATHEWNVTSDLPAAGPNLGLEAITWIPDSYLVGNGLIDESTAAPYDPLAHGDHADGLFFAGVEGTGTIYAFALDHGSGAFQRIASFSSGQPGVMALEFDRDLEILWTYCDDTCGNRATVFELASDPMATGAGRFQQRAAYNRPASLPNVNLEGFAIAPESECSGGQKSVFWTDDSDTGGHALWRGSLTCGPLF
jgi:hypothetical protein